MTCRVTEKSVCNLQKLRQEIVEADAVSFDFFDTLFIRPLCDPEGVFDIIGCRFGIHNFRENRKNAQAEAFRRMHKQGRREITLASIYECLEGDTVSMRDLMHAEYELELAIATPNQEVVELFCETVSLGKPVVIVSDMYLPKEFFVECIRRHGLPQVPLFISADFNATKRDSGELFDVLISHLRLAPGNILHIGDNQLADVDWGRKKGLQTFHYQERRRPISAKRYPPATSVAKALIRTHGSQVQQSIYQELGFCYGGPAAVGFLDWVCEQAKHDAIDHVLFMSRDGYILNRLANCKNGVGLPKFSYFYGSRVAFSLAAINEENFFSFIPFFLSGADGLSPRELLERLGVAPPSVSVMENLGLGDDVFFCPELHDKAAQFLSAFRGEILKICRRNRKALFRYLRQLGVSERNRVAIVDVGWNGTSQEAFELAIRNLIDVDVFGYYFCLANSYDSARRQRSHRMAAMISNSSTSSDLISKIYASRVVAELFFSAPHHAVIGWEQTKEGVVPVEDRGRADVAYLTSISAEITEGMELFAKAYWRLREQIALRDAPIDVAWPLLELIVEGNWPSIPALANVKNLDAWASSRNREIVLADYLV
jgi:FMN phosphatase YigB (HAD superfamily)